MKGVTGGPLLCIGDLLSDLEEKHDDGDDHISSPHSSPILDSTDAFQSSFDLTTLFQENYNQLRKALDGTDHSWTALTLKLCTSLKTANKLIRSTDANVTLLSERVQELQELVKKGDSTVAAAKALHVCLNQKDGSLIGSLNVE